MARWCPAALRVSFKLETVPELAPVHAARALARSGVHAVVANVLATRHRCVDVVTAGDTVHLAVDAAMADADAAVQLDAILAKHIVDMHTRWVAA